MSDMRHCDGPNCAEQAPLNDVFGLSLGTPSADNYIIVQGTGGNEKHFHNQHCLTNWTHEVTKEREHSAQH
jgi:hypothetical protein